MAIEPEYTRRLAAAEAEILAAGMKPAAAKPPLFRLFSLIGMQPRPPHYQNFAANMLQYGVFFGVTWGAIMYFFVWRQSQMSLTAAAIGSIVAGALFGLAMAGLFAWQSKNKKLRRWEDL